MSRLEVAFVVSWLSLGGVSCTSGHDLRDPHDARLTDNSGTIAPVSATERQVLAALPTLAANQETRVGAATVVAGPAYPSASGRTCRRVDVRSGADQANPKLACEEGSGWAFVPDVFSMAPSP